MNTPWGDLPVADAHVHFFSDRFFRALAKQTGDASADVPAILGWERPDPDPAILASRWVSELDRNGVQRASLIASVPGDEDSVDAAVTAYPERFFGYFLCDPTAPDAAERVRGAFARNLKGLCLFPAMHRYSICDPRAAAVIQIAADQPGTLVFVHCGVLSVGVRKKLGLSSPFDMRYSNPIDIHPVALAFPKVPFVVPHFGAGYLREALMLADLCANVYLDTSSTNSWVRYQTPEISLRDVFRRSLDVLGAGRLLFGTDSSFLPRGWNRSIFDAQCEVLHSLDCPKAEAAAIFGENLTRLLLTS
jgi:predicted TIM-barrel fold metal-dependent hydrolase